MKKIIFTLVIIMAMVFTGMQNTQAQQATIRVYWIEDCPDTCAYLVEYKVKNNCLHPPAEVCSGQQWITCSSDEVIFHCDYDCEDATSNPCMFIEGFATKYCSGPGGTIAKCTGYNSVYKTCLQFMNNQTNVLIEW
jgi:hypothetical protein